MELRFEKSYFYNLKYSCPKSHSNLSSILPEMFDNIWFYFSAFQIDCCYWSSWQWKVYPWNQRCRCSSCYQAFVSLCWMGRTHGRRYFFLTFSAFPIFFSNLNSNCSNLSDLRNLQEQVKNHSVTKNCSDLSFTCKVLQSVFIFLCVKSYIGIFGLNLKLLSCQYLIRK